MLPRTLETRLNHRCCIHYQDALAWQNLRTFNRVGPFRFCLRYCISICGALQDLHEELHQGVIGAAFLAMKLLPTADTVILAVLHLPPELLV